MQMMIFFWSDITDTKRAILLVAFNQKSPVHPFKIPGGRGWGEGYFDRGDKDTHRHRRDGIYFV